MSLAELQPAFESFSRSVAKRVEEQGWPGSCAVVGTRCLAALQSVTLFAAPVEFDKAALADRLREELERSPHLLIEAPGAPITTGSIDTYEHDPRAARIEIHVWSHASVDLFGIRRRELASDDTHLFTVLIVLTPPAEPGRHGSEILALVRGSVVKRRE